MMNRYVRTKLDYTDRESRTETVTAEIINERDREYKQKIKNNAETQNTKSHIFAVGDRVLLQQKKVNKWTTPYEPVCHIVYKVRGSSIWAKRVTDGREVCRDSTYFRYLGKPKPLGGEMTDGEKNRGKPDDWRKTVLRKARECVLNRDNNELNNQSVRNQQQEYQPEAERVNVPRRSTRISQSPDRYGDFVYY